MSKERYHFSKYSYRNVITDGWLKPVAGDAYRLRGVSAYHCETNEEKSMEKVDGSDGGASSRTRARTSKSVLQFLYGNEPVASSTCQQDEATLYSGTLATDGDIMRDGEKQLYSKIITIIRNPFYAGTYLTALGVQTRSEKFFNLPVIIFCFSYFKIIQ